ncbi:MAG: hypothetical protein C4523_04600 [Myxococcales bacterium]|nr:MAG: hypothetical protein C4523_04600 [Myxococcales bacterium]
MRRVYFVSRDGWTFMNIFRRLAPAVWPDGDAPRAVYLCLSRAAAFLASRPALDPETIARLPRPAHEAPTLLSCFSPFGLAAAEIAATANSQGIDSVDAELTGDLEAHPRVVCLAGDDKLRALAAGRAETMHQNLACYLERMGFFTAGRAALVDIGWTGGTQASLAEAYAARPDFPELSGFYFALRSGWRSRETSRSRMEPIVADGDRPAYHGQAAFSFLHGLESLCPAPHGTVVGYAQAEQRGEPIFMAESHPVRQAERRNAPTIAAVQAGVMEFAARYAGAVWLFGIGADDALPFARSVLSRLARHPAADEARRMLELVFSESFGAARAAPIGSAAPSPDAPLAQRLTGLIRRRHRQAAWGRGVVAAYRLPFVGFAYAVGGAYKLLSQTVAAPIAPASEKLAANAPDAGDAWTEDLWTAELERELEVRFADALAAHRRNAETGTLDPLAVPVTWRDHLIDEAANLVVDAALALSGRRPALADGLPLSKRLRAWWSATKRRR